MKIQKLSIPVIVLFMVVLLSCSKSDEAPVFAKENPLAGYLTASGFTEVSTSVDEGSYEFGITFKPLVTGKIMDIIVKLPDDQTNLRVTIF